MRQDIPLDFNTVVIKPMDFVPDCGLVFGLFISSQLPTRTPPREAKEQLDNRVVPSKPVLELEMPCDKSTDMYLWQLQKRIDNS
jgi:hypothetical protein